ncbi:MAG TPA: sn-glycerol-3-phosphate ABC transporter ATP-binding protein UgpC [Planctomycetota bacterium]|nr:sn-glycerol-3-phosphate ABC transporter ATP-binding protein UgpC [Planctomycetota bacterium]
MAKVVLKNVCKLYPGGFRAVNDANLEIADREFVVLVGPSGCGKSTTLRMIAGLEEISSGTIQIGDRVVNDIPPKDRDIAMVFQNYALYPHMSVFENMAFGLKLRRFPKEEIESRVRDAARILGITDLLERKPKALSGGQRQRVAVGRAIVRKPAAFLFDEPLSNLDAKLRVDMRVELNKLHQSLATTMIYVTHDQIEAMTLADRIVIMDKGEIQQVADPLVLYDQPINKYVAGFIGSPPMNFFNGVITRAGGGGLSFTDGAGITVPIVPELAKRVEGFVEKSVKMGIRPEMICDKESAHDWKNATVVNARVDVVEALGDQKVVYFSTEKNSFIGKLEAHVPASTGHRMDVAFNASKIHIFDPGSEVNLTCTAAKYEAPNLAELPQATAVAS